MPYFLIFSILFLESSLGSQFAFAQLKTTSFRAIHGANGRVLSKTWSQQKLKIALQHQVLAMVAREKLALGSYENDGGSAKHMSFLKPTAEVLRYGDDLPVLGSEAPLCASVPFQGLSQLAECTAFWINPHQVLTAAHCVADTKCEDWWFVQGYTDGNDISFSEQQVFTCKEILTPSGAQADLALLEMNQILPHEKAENLLPIAEAQVAVAQNALVFSAGFPLGLPLTISTEGQISWETPTYGGPLPMQFKTTLDTLPGNSGSPVIDFVSGQIIGIHTASASKIYTFDQSQLCWGLRSYSVQSPQARGVFLNQNIISELALSKNLDKPN